MTVEQVLMNNRPDLMDEERDEVITYISYMVDELPLEQVEVLNYAQDLFPLPTYH